MSGDIASTIALVAVLGLGAQWVAWRLRMPAIVLLAASGLVAGPLSGWLVPSQAFGPLLQPLVGLAVAVILFEGGLNLPLHELRHAASGVKRLASVGVLLAWLLTAMAARYVGGLTWPVSLVLGAILVVTGPTVIIPLLRHARLPRRPASFLKWEGIVNDPIGALLAVLVFEFFVYPGPASATSQVVTGVVLAIVAAAILGLGAGFLLGQAFVRGYVPEFLKAPSILGVVIAVYTAANFFQEEAGLLATTALGVVLGNMRLASIAEVRRFKESMAVLLVSGVFIVLTADLDPAIFARMDWRSAAFVASVLLVVRPTAVLLSTAGAKMSWRERLLVAWIAPRGIVAAAVAGVFGPELVRQGYRDAELLVPLVFAVILTTVVAHGFTIRWVARRLGLAAASEEGVLIVGASAWAMELARILTALKVSVMLADSSWHRLREARLSGISTHYGELLSDLSEQSLDLSGVGYVLAATDNDAYNALVCTRFAPELGRDRVLQLAAADTGKSEARALSRTLRGRVAFSERATYDAMVGHYYQGWVMQRTRLTESFDYPTYLSRCPEAAEQLLAVRDGGKVQFSTADRPIEPEPGAVVVCYTPERIAPPRAETDRSGAQQPGPQTSENPE